MNNHLLALLAVLAIAAISWGVHDSAPAGRAVAPGSGCCLLTCTDTAGFACPAGYFTAGRSCFDSESCNLGCCIDSEGYCYTNYVKGKCLESKSLFVDSRECGEYTQCLSPPAYPAGDLGYQFSRGSTLAVYSRQSAVRYGGEVVVDVISSEKKGSVEVEVSSSGFKRSYFAYDDGIAPDISAGDSVYSFAWRSSEHPAVSEITSVSLASGGRSSEFYLSPSSCFPLLGKPSGRPKLVFASSFSSDAGARALVFLSGFGLPEISSFYDVYEVSEPVLPSDASSKCPFSLTGEDSVVVFDKDTVFCEDKGSFVVVNNAVSSKYNFVVVKPGFAKELCRHITTTDEAENKILSTNSPPVVVIDSPVNNSVAGSSEISLSFSAFDDDAPVLRYSIFYDSPLEKVSWGYLDANTTTSRIIPTMDGSHEIMVKVEDSDGNSGWNSLIFYTNLSNFAVNSFDYGVKDSSVVVKFSYSHDYDDNLAYALYADGFIVKRGKMMKDVVSVDKITLGEGSHFIQASVSDRSGRTAFSEVYLVNTSQKAPPVTGSIVSSPPFPEANPGGFTTDDGSSSPVFNPVDDSGLFEPLKLCTAGADTGVRYKPAKCMDSSGLSVEGSAVSKDRFMDEFFYELEYSLNSCSDNVFFDIMLEDAFGSQDLVFSGVLDTGYGVSDRSSKRSPGDFTQLCIYSSLGGRKCFPFALKQCQNSIDDDHDGLVDLEDMGCLNSYDGDESDGTSECQDGLDNDFDGVVDAGDPACRVNGVYVKTRNNEGSATTQCQDSSDNDGDMLADLADPGCSSAQDDWEGDGTSECQDRVDNDGNGLVDLADPGCSSPVDSSELPSACTNGVDDDNDGFVDFPEDLGCSGAKDDSEEAEEGVCDVYRATVFRRSVSVSDAGISVYFELYACKERIAYEVYLKDRLRKTFYPLGSGILGGRENVAGREVVAGDYDEVCISTSDEDFRGECYDIE